MLSGINSKNMSFIVALLVVAAFISAYLLISQHIDKTIYTDVKQVDLVEEDE